jgi:diguanylate cyclase (GGDEF)-like protein
MQLLLDICLSGLDILVVEDDHASAIVTSRILIKHGAHVEIAVNGREALEKFEQRHVPLVVTDINMPGMSGIELARMIKELDPKVQFIATSANRDTYCLVSAIKLGFSDYLLKPFEFESLLLAVKRCNDVRIAQKQLADEQGKFHDVVECLGEGIVIKDLNSLIIYQNKALTEMFGDFTGSHCYKMFGYLVPCPECPTTVTLQDGQHHSACKIRVRNGEPFHIESTSSLLKDSLGVVTGTISIIHDVSERVKQEKTIHNMAFHDQLTGLSNRRLFEDRLGQAIAKFHRYGTKFGLLYLDLDNFKVINDTFGHETGDEVLIESSERIRSCCKRDEDTVSRQGGDEFCIIANCQEQKYLEEIAKHLLLAFSIPFRIGRVDITVTTSIGISLFPDGGTTPKSIEASADRAMYCAKRSGRNRYVLS